MYFLQARACLGRGLLGWGAREDERQVSVAGTEKMRLNMVTCGAADEADVRPYRGLRIVLGTWAF